MPGTADSPKSGSLLDVSLQIVAGANLIIPSILSNPPCTGNCGTRVKSQDAGTAGAKAAAFKSGRRTRQDAVPQSFCCRAAVVLRCAAGRAAGRRAHGWWRPERTGCGGGAILPRPRRPECCPAGADSFLHPPFKPL